MVVWTVPTVFQNSSVADPVSCLCQNEHRQRDFANRANGKRFNINRCEPPSEQRTILRLCFTAQHLLATLFLQFVPWLLDVVD